VIAKRPFAIGVEAVDDYGNLATSFDGTVTASLATDARHKRLDGMLTVQANGGRAVISDATVDKADKSYVITITASGPTPDATSAFSVTKPAAARGFAGAVRRASRLHLRGLESTLAHLSTGPHRHSLERHTLQVHRPVRGQR
jgi:hypothetical protein